MGHVRTCDRRPGCPCYAVNRAPLRLVVGVRDGHVLLACGHLGHEGDERWTGARRRCRACVEAPRG